MAFENFPQADDPRPLQQPAKKNNLMPIIVGLLVAALIGTWAYILYNKNKTEESLAAKDTQIATTSTQKDELQKELEDASMRYDMLKSQNTKMDSTISARDTEIAEKKKRIQELLSKGNASQAELKEAKSLIASLNSDIEDYKTQIEVLQGQKIQLTQEKKVVTEERDVARKNYDSANVVIKERESLIDIGSTLHASNFSIAAFKDKRSGKEKETDKAKRADKLRVKFDLDENRITQTGTKELYITITSPNGTVISSVDGGSGVFTTRDGQEKSFTRKMDVNYTQNQRQNVTFDWKDANGFSNGVYKIEVYNNGFKIGEGTKALKG